SAGSSAPPWRWTASRPRLSPTISGWTKRNAAMLAHGGSRRPALAIRAARRRSTISLTPLIDVVFILLVFFMLASSFLDWRAIDLRAPGPAAGASLEGVLYVEVRDDGLRLA